MYCSSCGSLIKDGQSFCANCGTPVANQAPQPAVQVQQPQPVVQPQPVIQPQYAQPVYQQPVAAKPEKVKKSKWASIAAFACGIPSLYLCWVFYLNVISVVVGFAGMILGVVAITKKNGRLKPMAVIGLILSFIGFAFASLVWISLLWYPEAGKIVEPVMDYLY